MTGYSQTPLARKLGIKQGTKMFLVNPPGNYKNLVAPLPDGVRMAVRMSPSIDVVHLFSRNKTHLTKTLSDLLTKLKPDGTIWVSWPKKVSGVASDITEDVVRTAALPLGLVDIKVCAVDETWSGLKLVLRKENRRKVPGAAVTRVR